MLKEAVAKNGRSFCLDKCLLCDTVLAMFVRSGAFLVISTSKLFDQGFYSKLSSDFRFDALNTLF